MAKTIAGNCDLLISDQERKPLKDIERSLNKKYGKYLWARFNKAVRDFELVEEGDSIAVAISGGKDSLLLAKLFQEMQKHRISNFNLHFIAMDPGFNSVNLDMLKENCDYLNIPVKIFKSDIFKIVDKIAADYPCYMCARMRRGALYSKAQELGCNKLALGHHFDDVIETTLLNVFYAGTFKTMLPKLKSKNFKGLELIRPMYYIHEEDIIRFTLNSGINPMNCGCIVAAKKTSSKRREIKRLIKELKKTNENIGNAILKATQNVNLDGLLGWKFNGQSHSFLDYYTDKVDQDIVED